MEPSITSIVAFDSMDSIDRFVIEVEGSESSFMIP
jgi:hypothetical protein